MNGHMLKVPNATFEYRHQKNADQSGLLFRS
ncbi:hypothetical protein [Gracilibacillus sp. Marseille-QA3620]